MSIEMNYRERGMFSLQLFFRYVVLTASLCRILCKNVNIGEMYLLVTFHMQLFFICRAVHDSPNVTELLFWDVPWRLIFLSGPITPPCFLCSPSAQTP